MGPKYADDTPLCESGLANPPLLIRPCGLQGVLSRDDTPLCTVHRVIARAGLATPPLRFKRINNASSATAVLSNPKGLIALSLIHI